MEVIISILEGLRFMVLHLDKVGERGRWKKYKGE